MRNLPAKMVGLRAVRLASGMTQTEIAKAAGIGSTMICRWERRDIPHTWKRLIRIAQVLGVTTDSLLGLESPDGSGDAISARDRRLLQAMERHALTMFGDDVVGRSGGWRRIAEIAFLGFLHGARDQDLARPKVPPPAPPHVPLNKINGRIWPKGYLRGWETTPEQRETNRKRGIALRQQRRQFSAGRQP